MFEEAEGVLYLEEGKDRQNPLLRRPAGWGDFQKGNEQRWGYGGGHRASRDGRDWAWKRQVEKPDDRRYAVRRNLEEKK